MSCGLRRAYDIKYINGDSQEDFPNNTIWTKCYNPKWKYIYYPKWEVVLGAPDKVLFGLIHYSAFSAAKAM